MKECAAFTPKPNPNSNPHFHTETETSHSLLAPQELMTNTLRELEIDTQRLPLGRWVRVSVRGRGRGRVEVRARVRVRVEG